MPSEIRHILFGDVEVGRAVRLYRERTGQVLPAGEPSVYVLDRDGTDMRFTMTMGSGSQSATVSTAGTELVAALILYCRGLRIPLPATAAKSLQRYGAYLCLVVTRNGGGTPLPNVSMPH